MNQVSRTHNRTFTPNVFQTIFLKIFPEILNENDFSTPIEDKPLQLINKLQEAKTILGRPVFVFSAKDELRKNEHFSSHLKL